MLRSWVAQENVRLLNPALLRLLGVEVEVVVRGKPVEWKAMLLRRFPFAAAGSSRDTESLPMAGAYRKPGAVRGWR